MDGKAHHLRAARFSNPWDGPEVRGFTDLLRWAIERRLHPPPRDPPAARLPRAAPSAGLPLPGDALAATWVGHSTALIECNGLRILTDPIWSEWASPLRGFGPRRWVAPPLPLEALPRIDLVLISHNHYDHLDRNTVVRLAQLFPGAEWLVPLGLSRLVRRFGGRLVRECDWWDEVEVGSGTGAVRVGCVPARHFSARTLFDRFASLWCGWAVRLRGRRVYFAGDTGYHPEFSRVGARFGPFDLTLMPIGAYDPRWFMRGVHLDPEEAVQAYRDLRSAHDRNPVRQIMMAVHWGTYKLTDEPMDEPPARARAAWRRAGLPEEDLWILAQGETKVLGAEC